MQRLLTLVTTMPHTLHFNPSMNPACYQFLLAWLRKALCFGNLSPFTGPLQIKPPLLKPNWNTWIKTSCAAVKFNIPTHSFDISGPSCPHLDHHTMDITGQFSHCLWRCHCLCDCHHRWCPMHCCRRPIKLHKAVRKCDPNHTHQHR